MVTYPQFQKKCIFEVVFTIVAAESRCRSDLCKNKKWYRVVYLGIIGYILGIICKIIPELYHIYFCYANALKVFCEVWQL